ncbi:MAG: hypothetical protein A3E83_07870 [Gammaproteobacteria bacterium RIFCSPHIGHO2_12_FULL_41_20]|nr:MAG: hypothetical protein A3E83_07870 [Gammaproteobacteria bacterium RIFCSPHIGHO2_12_FULL_41_20]
MSINSDSAPGEEGPQAETTTESQPDANTEAPSANNAEASAAPSGNGEEAAAGDAKKNKDELMQGLGKFLKEIIRLLEKKRRKNRWQPALEDDTPHFSMSVESQRLLTRIMDKLDELLKQLQEELSERDYKALEIAATRAREKLNSSAEHPREEEHEEEHEEEEEVIDVEQLDSPADVSRVLSEALSSDDFKQAIKDITGSSNEETDEFIHGQQDSIDDSLADHPTPAP